MLSWSLNIVKVMWPCPQQFSIWSLKITQGSPLTQYCHPSAGWDPFLNEHSAILIHGSPPALGRQWCCSNHDLHIENCWPWPAMGFWPSIWLL